MRRKKEVCGKPTQYNLQTLQYNWKELPDTHFTIPDRNYRVHHPVEPVTVTNESQGRENVGDSQMKKELVSTGEQHDEVEVDYSYFLQWSHDDIREMLRANALDLQNSCPAG